MTPLGGLAAAASALALIDPRLRILAWAPPILALLSLARNRDRPFLPALALTLLVPIVAGFSTGADSLDYFAYTSSLLADGDLDFRNQWARFGFPAVEITSTGLPSNPLPIGPGLLWAPGVAAAHLWLSLTLGSTDTLLIGPSYFAAAAAVTLALMLAGVFALFRALAGHLGKGPSAIACLAAVGASPILYYGLVKPLMSHGVTFGACALTVALTLRAERDGRRSAWVACGACLGLAMLCRTQAIALALFVAAGLWRGRPGLRTVLATAAAALAVFTPQMLAWKVLYGSALTIPQGAGFIDWRGRHAIDVLISADRGLFNWHPALLLGALGLLVGLPHLKHYAVSGLAILAFTAYLNGSVLDWNASDAFGARRFDLVVPLLALGLAGLVARSRPFLSAHPLAIPVAALVVATLWNVSLVDLTRGKPSGVIPWDDLASSQVAQARRLADNTFGRLGTRARDLIYRVFVGVHAYHNYRQGGDFDLATLDPRFLRAGWSDVKGWEDGSLFRYLLYPEACIVIPIDEPFDLRGFVLARSPARIDQQRLTLVLNGRALNEADLPAVWTEIPFTAPKALWRAGENDFCIRAARKRPGDEPGDLAYAAAVMKVQLP